MSKNRTLEISSLMGSSTNENIPLDLTEIEQSLNLWSELFPMIEKEILTLTNVAQEMQECSESEKYVDALMKIAARINDVEEKATTCIKEARQQLKKTQTIDGKRKILHSTMVQQQEEPSDDEEMEIDETNLNEQIEVSTLNFDSLTKLDEQLDEILKKPTNVEHFDLDSDNRYGDFADCIEQMKDVDQSTQNKSRRSISRKNR